ncbi:SRPBCC family protein [Mangrovicoccus sp. HB161399]|uniref:SRPBCC family protein n=1 Tax=Mangrovicoccus sp. HB161399 TaxID=2720392 RepID=UPI001553CF20|nr:SRPBCC family protein [Mangrovicoccus sp. HB161399]
MRLHSRETYEVPAGQAFAALTDYEALTGILKGHGVQVAEFAPGWPDGTETRWRLGVGVKGMHRDVKLHVSEVRRGEGLTLAYESDGIFGDVRIDIEAEGPESCAIAYGIGVEARGIAAKLMLQPLRMAQGTMEQKLHGRVVNFTRSRLGLR